MARTPLRLQRTLPTRQPLSNISASASAEAFGSGVGRAMQGLGQSLEQFAGEFSQREERSRNFATATDYARFQTGMESQLSELQRAYDPETGDFLEQANGLYTAGMDQFLSSVPDPLKEYYELQLERNRGTVVGNAMKFQYQEGDKWFRAEINDIYQNALTAVRNNPDSFDEQSEIVANALLSSDLSASEKIQLARDLRRGLQGVLAKGEIALGLMDPSALGVGGGGRAQYYAALQGAESGGRVDAKADTSSATGLFQFTTDTWNDLAVRYPESGIQLGGRTDPKQQRIAIELFTNENAAILAQIGVAETPIALHTMHLFGKGDGPKVLLASDDTPLKDIIASDSYAANAFMHGWTVADWKQFSAKKMGAGVEIDPRFSGLSYSDREALYNQATAQQQRQAAATSAAQNQTNQQFVEGMNIGVINGNVGQADVKLALDKGQIDSGDYWSLMSKIEQRDSGIALANMYGGAVQSGVALDASDKDVKTGANQWYDISQGQAYLQDRNVAYGQTLANGVQRTGVLPSKAAGQLSAMLNSGSVQDARYASGVIDSINRVNPTTAKRRFNDETLARADVMRVAQKYGMNEEEIEQAIKRAQGEDMTSWATIDKVGKQSRAEMFNEKGFGRVTSEFGVDQRFVTGAALGELYRDYESLHTMGYRIFRDEDKAHDYATGRLKEIWDKTAVGGVDSIVQYPVEKQYPTFTPDEIDGNLRRELGLEPDQEYILLSDDLTSASMTQQDGTPTPSYLVVKTDDEGSEMQIVLDPDNPGQNLRYFPTVDEVMRTERQTRDEIQDQDQTLSRVTTNLSDVMLEIDRIEELNRGYELAGFPENKEEIPPALLEARTRLETEREELLTRMEDRSVDLNRGERAIESTVRQHEAEMGVDTPFTSTNVVNQAVPVKKNLDEMDVNQVAFSFVGNTPDRTEADFSRFIREVIPTGPMQKLAKQDPILARQMVNDFWSASGYDQLWQLMAFHNKVAVFDAVYASQMVLSDVELDETYRSFVEDERTGVKLPMRDLLQVTNPQQNPEQFKKALLERLLRSRLTTGIFY